MSGGPLYSEAVSIRIWSPGRVNLIGDHTDYMGGLCLPFALPMGIAFTVDETGGPITLASDAEPLPAEFVSRPTDPSVVEPYWARYVAAVADELHLDRGIAGTLRSSLPLGAGVSSSAALCVGVATALLSANGIDDWDRHAVALVAQRAEQRASGVPCGLLDQLAITFGQPGHATLIDCADNSTRPVPFPDGLDVWILHSGIQRQLVESQYSARRSQCEAAESIIGALRTATLDDLGPLRDLAEQDNDDTLLRRAHHVISENQRVLDMVDALGAGDHHGAGALLNEGHHSLATDFATSVPAMDALVKELAERPGVFGARMTGGGFGGCVVALTAPGTDPTPTGLHSWKVRPSTGVLRQ